MNRLQKIGLFVSTAVASVVSAGLALAVDPTSVPEALSMGLTQTKTDIFAMITTNLGTILLVFAALMGIVIAIKLFRRLVK